MLLAVAVIAVGLAAVNPWAAVEPADAATPYSFRATADAGVDASLPATPLGARRYLLADGVPKRASYLRFTVAGLRQPVLRARLRLHVQNSSGGPSPSAGVVNKVTSNAWNESTIRWNLRPAIGARVSRVSGPAKANAWVELDVTAAVKGNGVISLAITQNNTDGVFFDSREAGPALAPRLIIATGASTGPPTTRPPTTRPPTTTRPTTTTTTTPSHPAPQGAYVLAAGDVAGCSWNTDEATAKIIDGYPGVLVAGLGDMVQDQGTAAEFRDCYGPTWGRFKNRTRPAVGNHEYLTAGAVPYWDYFGAAAGPRGKGWYSYDIGSSWHVIVLNANCWETGVSCKAGSEQEKWLKADLAAHSKLCTMAYWHQPRFSSIEGLDSVAPFWDDLYAAGVDLILNGHKHGYERFARQTPSGVRDDAHGIREIVVGTGGSPEFFPYGTPLPTSQVRSTQIHGVLRLDLAPDRYSWKFLPIAGDTFTDSGSTACH